MSLQIYLDTRAAEAVTGKNWWDANKLREITNTVRSDLGRMYRFLDKLDAQIAEIEGPAKLPSPRNRTAKQERVARCPRCGSREDAAA